MERYLTSRRLRSCLQSELDLRWLGSVLVVALLAGCSSSSAPAVSGGSGGNSSSVAGGDTGATGGQTPVAGATSAGGATAMGGSSSPGGTASTGASGGVTTATTPGGGATTSSGGLSAGGASPVGGNTNTGGVTPTGGGASGGLNSAGGVTSTGGTTRAGGNTVTSGTGATGGASITGGNSATGGASRGGGATITGGNSATGGRGGGGATSTGGAATGGATSTAGTTSSPCGATPMTYDTSAIATTCPAAVPGGVTSAFCSCVNEGQGYSTSGFSVANNVWGSNPGPECVWATNTTLWGFASNQPNTGGVKSYPNIGYSPRKLLSSINTYTSSFDITVPGNVGVWEAAYDIWVRTPGGGNTRIEIMIWMYTYKAGPISSIVATTKPTIGDYTWTVHHGSNGSNATISFVSNTNVTSGTVDIKAMLDWLIANNTTQYGIFDDTWTLDQVQWGWEISSDGGSPQEFINNCFSVSST